MIVRKTVRVLGLPTFLIILGLTICSFNNKESKKEPYNVLFIAMDDMRTELNCYGGSHIKSPNIDKLANKGVTFKNAYVQQAICMASRASIMTGYRPEQHGIYTGESVQNLVPDVKTMNKLFAENGYEVSAFGKIYHHKIDHEKQFGDEWFDPQEKWAGRGYYTDEAIEQMRYNEDHQVKGRNHKNRGPAYEFADVPDSAYIDGYNTEYVMRKLQAYKKNGKPFFLAMGFHKPHLPFIAPKKYWDMYPLKTIKQPEIQNPPKNCTPYTLRSWGELRNYYGMPKNKEPVGEDTTLILRRGYYACVSYVDALIGKLLNELELLDLDDNTIIVLWADHGYKLGDYGYWCKWSNMTIDTKVPLIFSVPGMEKGVQTKALAELQDMYPTLAELCNLELPEHVQGRSLVPVLENPEIEWDDEVSSVWPHNRRTYDETVMGYSIKSQRFNYIEWVELSTGEVLGRDLYDLESDPKETVNVIGKPEYKEIIADLEQECAIRKQATDHNHLGR